MRRLFRAAVILVLVASACGRGGGNSASPAGPSTADTSTPADPGASTTAPNGDAPTSAPPAGPAVPEALAFSVAGVDGAQVVGADYAGKDVALWFWAPW